MSAIEKFTVRSSLILLPSTICPSICLLLVLPEQPIILDRWGRQLNGTQLGPKQEGDDIVITCRVVGGKLKVELADYKGRT